MYAVLPLVGRDAPCRPNSKASLRDLRRTAQALFLSAWVALFVLTRWQMGPEVFSVFLEANPLVAALTMGASQIAVPAMAVSVILVAVALIFGRAFCGWICPLGTLIDLAAKLLRPRDDALDWATHTRLQHVKYLVLATMVFGALLSAQWVYLLDPLALLFRGVAVGVFPAINGILPEESVPEPLGMAYHGVAFAPAALLVSVILLTAITPRFYCRYLCPLGAFYGLLSRTPLLRRRVSGCDGCHAVKTQKQCVAGCRMRAVPPNPHFTQNHECIRCMSGRSICHAEAISFRWHGPAAPDRKDSPVDLDRRHLLIASGSGLVLAPLAAMAEYHRAERNETIRPPRVLQERSFTDQCIRCAMCVQACPTQTLQLTHLESGVAGFWTPAVTPQVGGCIPDCNACAKACPTAAIPRFGKAEDDKWSVKMGTVVLEKNRCICFTEKKYCGECLDICPTKAFVIEPKRADVPRRPASVDYFRCVGCGLCESVCRSIVFGDPALKTFSHGRGVPTSLWERPSVDFEPPQVLLSSQERTE